MSPAANQAAATSAQPKTNDWPGLALRSIVVAAAVCAGAWLSLTGLRTPAPRPAIATEFSAIRAADRAHALLGDQPRPVGSAANAATVERLASWLRARKMEVEVQEATVRAGGRDVTLRNIIACRTGALPGKAVLFVAHHDTVAASPGAGDDGMGVAIALELADALNVDPWPGRDVIVLLTDGEEAGLLGAKHFAENHRWMANVGCVLNIDHRGNAGPCLLYETGPDTARVLEPVAPLLGPVVANSTFAEISRHMPYATDFQVFRERGVPGLNFAVVDGLAHYHQPTDTWANADLSSLQHQGDMVLPAMYALSTAKEDRHKIEGDAVFLDVAGSFLAWWPARAGVVARVTCTLVACALGWLAARRSNMPKPTLAMGFAASMVRAIVASGFTWLALWALARGGAFGMEAATAAMPDASMFARYRAGFWPATGPWLLVAAMLLGVLAAWFATARLVRRANPLLTLCSSWMLINGLIAVLAIGLPGVTAPLLPVSLVATATLVVCVLGFERCPGWAALVAITAPVFVASFTLAPIQVLAWTSIGLSMPAFAAACTGLAACVLLAGLATPRTKA